MYNQAMNITFACEFCGKNFEVPGFRARAGKVRFCSRSCLGKAKLPEVHGPRLAAITGKKAPNNAQVEIQCTQCRRQFKDSPSRSDRKFCSENCYHKSRRIIRDVVLPPPKPIPVPLPSQDICPICGKGFKRHYCKSKIRQVYCSRSCSFTASYEKRACLTCSKIFPCNKRNPKEYCSRKCVPRHKCECCGKTIIGRVLFQAHGETRQIRFCSRQCASMVNRTLKGSMNYVVRGFAATIRRLGEIACERCGFDDPDGLTVHHRDRNRKNNQDDNLETLCGTCHALEHWKGGKKRQTAVRIAKFMAGLAQDNS